MRSAKPGTVIAARYRLVRPLGTGGSATVWAALDTSLERAVAVKLLRDHAVGDPAERERLRREARTLARLVHPHIVAVLDYFETVLPDSPDEQPILVTELVDGTNLEQRLEQGALPWAEAVLYCSQLADALRAAHQVGIVHRDVKPGNLILVGQGVKLLDFGIAQAKNDSNLTGNLTIGTPLCMAPEQIRGRGALPASDIYALGCVLYWCLTGSPPHNGNDIADIFEAHLCDPPPRIEVPGLPKEIADFALSCLEKNPTFRPDAQAAVAALGAPTDPAPAVAPPVTASAAASARGSAVRPARPAVPEETEQSPAYQLLTATYAPYAEDPTGPGETSTHAPFEAQAVGAAPGYASRPDFEQNHGRALFPALAVLFSGIAVGAVILFLTLTRMTPATAAGAPAGATTAAVTSSRTATLLNTLPPTFALPSTLATESDSLGYLEAVRAQIGVLIADGSAAIDPNTGGDLQNSIIDIENSVISAKQNGGAAHLVEIRGKIADLDAHLVILVGQQRIAASAANQLTAELQILSNTVTD